MVLTEKRKIIYEDLISKSKDTPLYKIIFIPVPNRNKIFAKEEYLNQTGSNFDRIYPYLFMLAEEKGYIVPEITPVIEVTTGNAGAAFAWCAQKLRYKDCTVIIHEDAPKSRIKQIKSLGAKVVFSPAKQYTQGYIPLLEKILRKDKEAKGGKIGKNPKRIYCITKIIPEARLPYYKLAEEATEQLNSTEGENSEFNFFLSIVGSGDFISGVGERLKKINPKIKIVAIEPSESRALSALKEGKILNQEEMKHELFGAIPFGTPKEKLNINFDIIDEIKQVSSKEWQEAKEMLEKLEKKKVGRSSAAELAVALKICQKVSDKNFLITFHDPSWKYEDDYAPEKFKV